MPKKPLPRIELPLRKDLRADLAPKALDRWQPDLRHAPLAAAEDGPVSISILDPIGADFWDGGVTAKRVSAVLRAAGSRDVEVTINSPGGDYFEGLAIYNALREHKGAVTIKIIGLAASAASVIAMAGDEIQIARAGFLMIHNTWVYAAGDRHGLREVADWLEPFDLAAVDLYAARSGMDAAEIRTMLDRETWMGGAEAVEKGFADALLPADEIAASADPAARAAVSAERKLYAIAVENGLEATEARQLVEALKGSGRAAAETEAQAASITRAANDLRALLQAL